VLWRSTPTVVMLDDKWVVRADSKVRTLGSGSIEKNSLTLLNTVP